MKTMKKGNEIIRIKDNDYKKYLNMGYNYTSKSEYKKIINKKKDNKTSDKDTDSNKRGKKSNK